MGDGILAYFGYPQAHEEDAERAVRTGLELIEAAAKLDDGAGTALHMRVAIATGLVVVGDLRNEGVVQEHDGRPLPDLAGWGTVSILSVHGPGSSCRARALEIDLPGSMGKWIKVPSAEFLGL
jgi:hypothetical protein